MKVNMRLDFRIILKRMVFCLVCFSIALLAFQSNIFSACVFAAGDETIDVFIYSDLNKTKENMNKALGDFALKEAKTVNIVLSEDILISQKDSAFGVLGMGNGYFFNFTNARFEGKTINIKSASGLKIKILNKNDSIGFLTAKNCTVNLENIVLDGGGIYKNGEFLEDSVIRSNSFIEIKKRGAKIAALNLIGSSINNCVLADASGGAISSRWASVVMDKNSSISNCSVFDQSDISGGAIDLVEGTLLLSGGSFITNCHVNAEEDVFGGAISMRRGTVVLRDGSNISNCSVGACENASGGAIYLAGGVVSLNSNSHIDDCVASANEDASGGAICLKGGTVNIFDSKITSCVSSGVDSSFGGGICSLGGAVNMFGKSEITGCISKSDGCSFGGGISVFGGKLNLQSGNILNCLAQSHGDAVHFGGSGEYKVAPPNGDLKISILSKDNSHNSDAKTSGYWGIYKDKTEAK